MTGRIAGAVGWSSALVLLAVAAATALRPAWLPGFSVGTTTEIHLATAVGLVAGTVTGLVGLDDTGSSWLRWVAAAVAGVPLALVLFVLAVLLRAGV